MCFFHNNILFPITLVIKTSPTVNFMTEIPQAATLESDIEHQPAHNQISGT